jgi:hypothetical protein
MAPLSPEMPLSDKVLYVFYDFETTKNIKLTKFATIHVPNQSAVNNFVHCVKWNPALIKTVSICARGNPFWEETL